MIPTKGFVQIDNVEDEAVHGSRPAVHNFRLHGGLNIAKVFQSPAQLCSVAYACARQIIIDDGHTYAPLACPSMNGKSRWRLGGCHMWRNIGSTMNPMDHALVSSGFAKHC